MFTQGNWLTRFVRPVGALYTTERQSIADRRRPVVPTTRTVPPRGLTSTAAVLQAAGVPLAVHGKIPLASFAQLTFIAAVSGGVLLAVLIRHSSAPRQRFVRITTGLTALSCVLPAVFADTTASKTALVVLHILAAAIIVPALARHAH